MIIAQVCLNTCGLSCLPTSELHFLVAVWAWRLRTYATPQRLNGSPRALTNTSSAATAPRTANQARNADAVVFQSGNARSRRPFPYTRMLADCCAIASMRSPVSSETRRPALIARCNRARSRTPSRVAGSGASSKACTSFWSRYGTRRLSVFLKGIARTRRTWASAAGSRC